MISIEGIRKKRPIGQVVNQAARSIRMAALERRKVLVVEDDDGMREAFERLLAAAGYECSAFTSAEELLARGVDPRDICVVCDLKLPAMSGLELLDESRARGGWPPLILITAHDTPDLRAEALKRGASAYLAKPFRGTALLDAVKEVVRPETLS
jgi:FixJ family two-component response regulator